MDAAAFSATFSDFKVIRGRKVCQLVFEVPIENADAALAALGGVPRPDAEIWVGVARLAPCAASKPANEAAKAIEGPSEYEKRKWRDLRPAQQAALRCKQPAFQRFVAEVHNADDISEQSAIEVVREACCVASRSDILEGTRAATWWRVMDESFQAWLQVDAH